MSTERSDQLHHAATQAATNFDYFMAGLCTALLGYLIPTLKPGPLGWNPGTLEVGSVVLLLGASLSALKRLENTVLVLNLNAKMLYHQEMAGSLVDGSMGVNLLLNQSTGEMFSPKEAGLRASEHSRLGEAARELAYKAADSTLIWYQLRNWLFMASLVLLLVSRVWSGYFA